MRKITQCAALLSAVHINPAHKRQASSTVRLAHCCLIKYGKLSCKQGLVFYLLPVDCVICRGRFPAMRAYVPLSLIIHHLQPMVLRAICKVSNCQLVTLLCSKPARFCELQILLAAHSHLAFTFTLLNFYFEHF